ncbi:hypothetical protein CTAYLR_006459 [Chrysophaeum taylorii]|uniref:Potassium channel domain-containing protein n=1 Tax=Chrysophaeum taylorii TaxID=2483200 RepID=A0AAD7XM13_9STRA|nr:hypothetical protein CTAYLR_006459 [Chrysophaeum taylorii]
MNYFFFAHNRQFNNNDVVLQDLGEQRTFTRRQQGLGAAETQQHDVRESSGQDEAKISPSSADGRIPVAMLVEVKENGADADGSPPSREGSETSATGSERASDTAFSLRDMVMDAGYKIGSYTRVMTLVTYYGSGSLFFVFGPEKFTFINSVYFLTVTLTTVGYGDVTPSTIVGQIVAIFYIFAGIIVVFPILAEFAMVFVKKTEDVFKSVTGRKNTSTKLKVSFAVVYILVPLLLGSMFFGFQEARNGAWTPVDPLWWTIATVTTVGYGDLSFHHKTEAHLFLIFFIPLSVVAVGAALTNLSNAHADAAQERKERALLAKFDMDMIRSLDTNGDGVDRNEYILGMLQAMELVSNEKIKLYSDQFDEYDADGSGLLDADDLDIIEQNMKKGQLKAV